MERNLTDRQLRELEYHRDHARLHAAILDKPFDYDVLTDPARRWWNAYWQMYAHLLRQDVVGKRLLVVGCGFGHDALRLAKIGALVSAFDLSKESLEIAKAMAAREQVEIDFAEMPAEAMTYGDSSFDFIVARDIMHHVDVRATMTEIVRVAKPNALMVLNEIYSHSWTELIRRSPLVEKILYPRMQRLIYGPGKPYITEDERKLTENDIRMIRNQLHRAEFVEYYNFVVTRIVPDRFESTAKADRLVLRALGPIGAYMSGRILFGARVNKEPSTAV